MLEVPGLGPKKIRALHAKLGVKTLAELTAACTDGRVAALDGFGEKSQQKIVEGIRNREAYGRRHLWWDAEAVAEPILAGLRALPQVARAESAGSLRRGWRLSATSIFWWPPRHRSRGGLVLLPAGVREVTARGETKASVRFEGGLQADLRIVPAEQFVFALHHFTGSKDHNVQMRQRALARGLSMSEWGLVPAAGEGTAKEKAERRRRVEGGSEKETLCGARPALHPPRVTRRPGEIEAAEAGRSPRLIQLDDLRGAFHNHTTASDGRNTLRGDGRGGRRHWAGTISALPTTRKSSFQANGLEADAAERPR